MGCVILSSYLVLFVLFYIDTYKKKSRSNRKAKHPNDKSAVMASSVKESAAKMADGCATGSQHTSRVLSKK